MSSRDPAFTLRQILGFAEEVAALLAARTRADFDTNREFRRALERCIELSGEAATRLSPEWREAHPQIPWREIIAMRNVLIHGYDIVVPDVLWNVACRDIPALRSEIEQVLAGAE